MQGIDIAAFLQRLPIYVIPMLFAITLHEVAHGWMAKRHGDPTAFFAGRLTLNPIKHIDPIGTVVVPLALLLLTNGAMVFGWAKPVPVAFNRLRDPRRDMILVAAAGPGSNLAMALGWAVLAGLLNGIGLEDSVLGGFLIAMCGFGILVNVVLAVFNLFPLPPLDGGRVLAGLLPPDAARVLESIEPYGFLIVVVLLYTGVLWRIMEQLMFPLIDLFSRIGGFG